MILCGRPAQPSDFKDRVFEITMTVRALGEELDGEVGKSSPDPTRVQDLASQLSAAIEAESKFWQTYTGDFWNAQERKCGFCESRLIGAAPQLEHFYPKSSWDELQAQGIEWGTQRVRKRAQRRISPIGFWWLAFNWDNWLAACGVCNSRWKKCFFPVQGLAPGHTARLHSSYRPEPLLLNPFDGPDPETHLVYDDLGAIGPRPESPYGEVTIRTCGLHRPSLAKERKRIYLHAKHQAEIWIRALEQMNDLALSGSTQGLVDLCAPDAPYSGVARYVVYEVTGIPYSEFREIPRTFRSGGTP